MWDGTDGKNRHGASVTMMDDGDRVWMQCNGIIVGTILTSIMLMQYIHGTDRPEFDAWDGGTECYPEEAGEGFYWR